MEWLPTVYPAASGFQTCERVSSPAMQAACHSEMERMNATWNRETGGIYFEEQVLDMGFPVATQKCYKLRLTKSTRKVGLPGKFEALTIFLDLGLWQKWDPWLATSYTISFSGVALDFTGPTEMAAPNINGNTCAVGQICQYALKRTTVSRKGGEEGTKEGEQWGYCSNAPLYSIPACQQRNLKLIIPDCMEPDTLVCKADMCPVPYSSSLECFKAHPQEVCHPQCNEEIWEHTVQSMPFGKEFLLSRSGRMLDETNYHLQRQYTQWTQNAPYEGAMYPVAGENYTTLPAYRDALGQKRILHCAMTANCTYELLMEYIRDNVVSLIVYPQSLETTEMSESATVELAGLLSGIGGNIGLFLGISGMTLIEWLEFFAIAACTYTCCAKKVLFCHTAEATDPTAAAEVELHRSEIYANHDKVEEKSQPSTTLEVDASHKTADILI